MSEELRGILPKAPHRGDRATDAQAEYMEAIPGEVNLDRLIKAQSSAPQVVRRISELEFLIWELANELIKVEGVTPLVEKAKYILKNVLEIDETIAELLGVHRPPEIVAAMHDESKMSEIKSLLTWYLYQQKMGLITSEFKLPEENPFYTESDLIQRTERLLSIL
jgi:hypothetical protein